MACLQVWWRSYLPLDMVVDPSAMSRKAKHEAGRAHTFWRHRPVPGSMRVRWLYAEHPTGAPAAPRGRTADPLAEPLRMVEHDADAALPPWATHLMLLITAEVVT